MSEHTRIHTSGAVISLLVITMTACVLLLAGPVRAQNPPSPAEAQEQALINAIDWKKGPLTGKLGDVAQIEVPAGYLFIEKKDMGKFAELNKNPPSDSQLGAVLSESEGWFIVFSFAPEGYIKDDEKDQLDADAILKVLQEDAEQSNQYRRSKGWPTIQVTGWAQPPAYDPQTHNLVWATRIVSEGQAGINYNTRILGRTGYISAILVATPEEMPTVVPVAKDLLRTKFSFNPGQRYADFRQGDKVAAYGLTALIAGGATAVAAKTGLLGKLIKPLIVGAVVILAAIGSVFKRIFGGGARTSES